MLCEGTNGNFLWKAPTDAEIARRKQVKERLRKVLGVIIDTGISDYVWISPEEAVAILNMLYIPQESSVQE